MKVQHTVIGMFQPHKGSYELEEDTCKQAVNMELRLLICMSRRGDSPGIEEDIAGVEDVEKGIEF